MIFSHAKISCFRIFASAPQETTHTLKILYQLIIHFRSQLRAPRFLKYCKMAYTHVCPIVSWRPWSTRWSTGTLEENKVCVIKITQYLFPSTTCQRKNKKLTKMPRHLIIISDSCEKITITIHPYCSLIVCREENNPRKRGQWIRVGICTLEQLAVAYRFYNDSQPKTGG